MILLLNLMIAILTTTYQDIEEQADQIYRMELQRMVPLLKYDDQYGCLVSGMPLFNVFSFLCLPFILGIKRGEQRGIKLNSVLMKMEYVPVFLISVFLFLGVNSILVPFAYLKIIWVKIQSLVTPVYDKQTG
jgi:hypothetical protein